jgi:putative addiction module component (TIGR02574 family)
MDCLGQPCNNAAMTDPKLLSKVLALSDTDRLSLLIHIWESLEPAPTSISDEEKEFIDRRLAEHERNPDAAVALEEVEKRLRRKRA